MKLKITEKNTQASKKYLEEFERVDKLEKQFTAKQAEATLKLEALLRKKQDLDAEFVSQNDPDKLDKLGKIRRDLRLSIEDEELLVTLDVASEVRKHMHAIKQYNAEANKEFEAFKAEANAELAELKKKYEADQAEINALMASHPFNQATRIHLSLLNRTRAR